MWNWLLPDRPPAALEAARREATEASGAAAKTVAGGAVIAGVRPAYHGEPTATAVDVRRQKDAELRANDAYWTKRLASQEQQQLKHNALREREFNAAVSCVCLFSVVAIFKSLHYSSVEIIFDVELGIDVN